MQIRFTLSTIALILMTLSACGGGGGGGSSSAAVSAPSGSSGGSSGSGGTASYPADVLGGLANWKLTLPVGSSNSATEIKQPNLASYSDTYFALNSSKTAVVMTDIFGGARTSTGTAYARTELREMNGSSNAAWSCTTATRSMTIRQRITRSPINKPEMSVGQIHDSANDMLEIRYIGPQSNSIGTGDGLTDTGKIQAHWNNDSSSDVLDSAYKIGDMMQVTISTNGAGSQSVSYKNERTNVTTTKTKAFSGVTGSCYFKAGNYHQACTKTDIYGASNAACVGKGWASGRYETDPWGISILEMYSLSMN